MSDALDDVRAEYWTLYGVKPDDRFATLLTRIWHDGKDAGRNEAFSEIADHIEEIR